MSDGMRNQDLSAHGWTAVPRSQSRFLADVDKNRPAKFSVDDIELPDSDVVRKTHAYAKKELPERTFNHSMRVYYYGAAIARIHFVQFEPFLETYFLACLLHDIGTTQTNITATRLSFEFQGGLLASSLLKEFGAPMSQAESVTEAIIRHQDLGDTGNITSLGQLIQLATVFDNIGMNPFLIHRSTIDSVIGAYPRNEWSSCFAATIRQETALKPWSHTTSIEGFAEKVEANVLMEPWD
ncbi:cyanamide hydratase [Polyplosphaeria fusca]|uniref:Cyanamide hydratase n=1 Tax=Polyplosphaeria fusca TaxID=682080 RepID=A0A9P4R4K6_9PLEO|nr:cyanamide hydratase [Polyplosphaeria fusca]